MRCGAKTKQRRLTLFLCNLFFDKDFRMGPTREGKVDVTRQASYAAYNVLWSLEDRQMHADLIEVFKIR